MANKKIQQLSCLAVGLLSLLLGACTSLQNVDSPPPQPATEDPDAWTGHAQRRNSQADKSYDDVWERIRDGFRLPRLDTETVDHYVEWYTEHPEYLERLANRASMYLYYIVEELERNDFPMEIALLPAIESAYRPTAYSHAHASGMWQFISATGSRYGLKQNWWYDGRRDIVGSTRAAIEYLSFLRDEFDGNWFHALASYNTGERRVRRAILSNRRAGKPTDYQYLDLRRETERYVPKLLAIKRIVSDPQRYGVNLEPIANQPYFEIVDTGSQIDLSIVAEAAEISTSELRALNPGFRRWATDPEGPHRILVPVDAAPRVATKLAGIPADKRMRWASYNVRRGDTLGQIARHYGVSVNALQTSNRLSGTLIRTGQTLLVPLSTQALADGGTPSDSRATAQARDQRRWVRYDIRRGDTLSGIAERHDISLAALKTSNGLRGSSIRAGQSIRVPTGRTASSTDQPIVHQVQRGDTLWRIAKRYKVGVKQLQSWNEIAAQDILRLGQKIMVYAN